MLIFIILAFIFPPIGIPLLIIYFLTHKKGSPHPSENKDWYLQLSLSKEDTVSQWFFLLFIFFLGVTLLILNRDFGDHLSWRLIVILTSVVGLIVSYYFKVVSTLIFSLIGIASWWGIQAFQWIENKDIKTSSIFAGLIFIALFFYVLGHFHQQNLKYKRFGLVYLILGIISITGALFIFGSKPGLGAFAEMTKGGIFFNSWEITTSLLLFIISLIGLTLYSTFKKIIFISELATIFILAILFGITAILPQQTIFIQASNNLGSVSDLGFGDALSGSGVLWAIIFNLVVFFELLGLIFSGYQRREEWLINIGAFFLFILIIVKYFDWFFTFLDKSLFFIGAGILLFAVGWFMEKSRRYMISNIKTEQQPV